MVSENVFLLHALEMGLYFTFVYDLFRIARRVAPHNRFFVSLEDLGFWVYCGAEVFLLMYRESNGTLRWFAVLGALAGSFLYGRWISPFFVKYASLGLLKVRNFLGKIIRWLFAPLIRVMRKSARGAGRVRQGAHTIAGRILRRIKIRLTSFLKMVKICLKK